MVDINWGLAGGGNNALAMFQQGAQMGMQIRQRERERATDEAIAGYAANPSNETALGVVKADPRTGLPFMQQEQQRAQAAQAADIRRRAAGGDQAAMTELFANDLDAWGKLDAAAKDKIKGISGFMGNAVQAVASLPEEQRAAAWSTYVRDAEGRGYDIPPEMEAYTPQALQSAAVRFEVVDKFLKMAEPDWRVVPPGGYLENVNPRSRSTPIGGAPQAAPQGTPPPPPGFIIDGQGGPTQPASGGFPGR